MEAKEYPGAEASLRQGEKKQEEREGCFLEPGTRAQTAGLQQAGQMVLPFVVLEGGREPEPAM